MKSRSQFAQYVVTGRTGGAACGECDRNYLIAVQRERHPGTAERRATKAEKAERERAVQHQRRQQAARRREREEVWRRACQVRLQQQCRLSFDDDLDVLDWLERSEVPLRVEAAVLALLRYAPSTAPIPAVADAPFLLTPGNASDGDVVKEWFHRGLLDVHPGSPLNAFVWTPSAEEVASAVDGTDDAVTPRWTSFYPLLVSWFAPYATDMATGAQALDAALTARLDPALMTDPRQAEFLRLAAEMIAAETVFYLRTQLALHHFPPVPENHRARLQVTVERLASVYSIGQCYSLAWKAARSAAATARQHPYAPLENMSTHALNVMESEATSALGSGRDLPTYQADSRSPLSALTRTVFLTMLGVDPFTTSVPKVTAGLPPPVAPPEDRPIPEGGVPGATIDLRSTGEVWALVTAPPRDYDPSVVRAALVDLAARQEGRSGSVSRATAALLGVYDVVAAHSTDHYAPVLAAAAATRVLMASSATVGEDDNRSSAEEVRAVVDTITASITLAVPAATPAEPTGSSASEPSVRSPERPTIP